MPDYLEKRRQLWYAVLTVPKSLQAELGIRFVKSTGTGDKRKASTIAAVFVAGWKLQIEEAKGNDTSHLSKAIQFRGDIQNAKDAEDREALELALINHLDRGDDNVTASDKEFYAVAMGHKTLSEPYYKNWKAQLTVSPRTIEQYSKDVTLFIDKFSVLEQVTKGEISLWLDCLASNGASKDTQKRIIKGCRNYWKYVSRYGIKGIPDDPFYQAILTDKGKKKPPREPFEPHEIVALWATATNRHDNVLADLIALAAYTGCRIEELCSLMTRDVSDNVLNVTDSKTAAGVRAVPIHSRIIPLVKRLKEHAKDAYLLPNLTPDKFGDRSPSVSRRFTTLKTKLGHGSVKVFHSLRHSAVTSLVNAGVLEFHIADIVGHEKKGITGNVYAHTIPIDIKREAIEKLRYPFPELT
jgi:integrase